MKLEIQCGDAVLFYLGQTVYWPHRPDTKGLVSAVLFRPNCVEYGVKWSHDMTERWHAASELSTEPPTL